MDHCVTVDKPGLSSSIYPLSIVAQALQAKSRVQGQDWSFLDPLGSQLGERVGFILAQLRMSHV